MQTCRLIAPLIRCCVVMLLAALAGSPALAQAGCVSTPSVHAVAEISAYLGDVPLPVAAEKPDESGCLTCHTDAGKLIGMVKSPEAPPEDGCAAAPTRPPFLGYFVNPEFPATLHGELGCIGCHGGDGTASDADAAHIGLKNGEASCTTCHADKVAAFFNSPHNTLSGMAHALELRSGEENFAALDHAWDNDCATCHADCGDCHLSLPEAVGGGLIKGHMMLTRAPMEDSCALCHGSRAGGEYLGHFEGIEPDVHFEEEGMHCLDCHKNDLHGDGTLYETRWDVADRAQCTDCHDALPKQDIEMHIVEHTEVACQVCHAQPYQNCFDCHTGIEDGKYFRRAGSKELLMKFGRNTADGYPYDFVTLRNNPVARHSFDYLGDDLLPDFDAHPTWKTAAPHNIRLRTPQTGSCWNCHLNEDLFLKPGDLDPQGAAANTNSTLAPRSIE